MLRLLRAVAAIAVGGANGQHGVATDSKTLIAISWKLEARGTVLFLMVIDLDFKNNS